MKKSVLVLLSLVVSVLTISCDDPLSPPGPDKDDGYIIGAIYLHSSHTGPENILIKTETDSVLISINQDISTYRLLATGDSIRVYDPETGAKMTWNSGGGIENNPSFCVIWRSYTILPIHAMM